MATRHEAGLLLPGRLLRSRICHLDPAAAGVADVTTAELVKVSGNEATTPSGVKIKFQSAPKRQYWVNDAPVPSVTEVNDVLGKPLVAWGQGIGVEGVLELIRQGQIGKASITGEPTVALGETPFVGRATKESVVALLKEHQLDHKAELTRAQDRGTAVHLAMESYINTGVMPDPEFYQEEHRGYVRGLVKFLTDLKIDKRAKVYSEVRVGSPTHGYAGTFDLLCKLLPCELHTTPLRKKEEFKGRGLLDLKTSSSVWDSHFYQLSAYKPAAVECGYPEPEWEAVVRVTADGLYEVKRNTKTLQDFLVVLATWRMVKGK